MKKYTSTILIALITIITTNAQESSNPTISQEKLFIGGSLTTLKPVVI
ncbi:MAG: hypothetical protein H7331_02560 [Bacteroidia bacterium]|nr:hypothetical protein [Bacteroidia bacterium]